ncbi:MAG: branched-chain amino acid ABC transporter permease [Betaproteobacteria bacterium]|nr:branched-chain amino acid ABC transporter permease [Betaproteobacteria bacterium]
MRFLLGALLLLAVAAIAPAIVRLEYFYFAGFVVLQFIVLATAWNILGGFAGYVNFGAGAFFAVGAYTAVALYKAMALPLGLQILAGAATAGLLGLGVGVLTLRLRGIFFSIATIAITIILETFVANWGYVGGAKGLPILRPTEIPLHFENYTQWLFFVMTFIAIVAVAAARWIQTSWVGRGLRAIRDNEGAAECSGVPTLKLKLFAATLSGALMGAAGAPFAQYLSFIEPSSVFSLNYAVNALAMPIIGGTAHWLGPIIGAVLLGTVQQVVIVTISSEVNVLVVGVMLVFFVVAAPEGILGLVSRLRRGKGKP